MSGITRRGGMMMQAAVALWLALPVLAHAQGQSDLKAFEEALRKAQAFEKEGNTKAAIQQWEKMLELATQVLGPDHEGTATVMANLAELYRKMGEYTKAEPIYQRSLQIREATLGKDHPDTAASLNRLAVLYVAMGQYAKAEPLLQRSLQIREARLGKDHPDTATSLNELAMLYRAMGQYALVEPLYQRSLHIWEARLGKDHLDTAMSLNNLANLYSGMGQYAKAESLYQRSLQICETKVGKEHPYTATSLNNLAVLYKDTGQYAKAEPLFQRSLQIREARLGKDHPTVALALENLALLYAAQERWDAAAEAMGRMRRIVRGHVARTLPILSENDQLTFLQRTDQERFHAAQSLGLTRRSDPATVALSAAWVLNGKAVAQQSLAERALLSRDSADPKTARLASESTSVRQQLAALTLAAFKPEAETERRKQLARLTEQEQELSRQLGQAAGRPARTDPWIDLNEVRKTLPTDAVLIEISRFNVANLQAKGNEKQQQGERYAAWLISAAGKGNVQLIDLGPARKIDDSAQAVRQALLAAQGSPKQRSTIQEHGEPDSEKMLHPPLEALAKLVLEPLAEHIDSKQRWIISPDGALWLIPWAALPLKDGSYAIEQHHISYVVSGRDLVAGAAYKPAKRDPPLVMADPDFDLDLKVARAETSRLSGQPTPPESELRGLTTSDRLPRAGRLPGTATEAKAIAPHLQRWSGEKPWVYQKQQALEGVFKSFRSPKVVVLSTHGFFLADQEVPLAERALAEEKRPALTKEGKPLENPLLRCGLLLAGCNNRDQKRSASDEDGVLTGLEIVGTDLRGTELVVLSACETGLGQVRNGEGVAGLRQAFQLAGAQSVVATLWQVPDRETALLMGDFFQRLADGKGKADALRQAQLAMIKERREKNGGAHPFFWAAFTLTGQGQ